MNTAPYPIIAPTREELRRSIALHINRRPGTIYKEESYVNLSALRSQLVKQKSLAQRLTKFVLGPDDELVTYLRDMLLSKQHGLYLDEYGALQFMPTWEFSHEYRQAVINLCVAALRMKSERVCAGTAVEPLAWMESYIIGANLFTRQEATHLLEIARNL